MPGTIGGYVISEGMLTTPRVGIACGEVLLAESAVLSGTTTLTVEDLTVAVNVVRGGTVEGLARYFLAGGTNGKTDGKYAGWGTKIPKRPEYQNDLGVKLSTLIRDDARACGEQYSLDPGAPSFDPALDRVVGPRYLRSAGRAWDTLGARRYALPWWVDYTGMLQVRARSSAKVQSKYRLIKRNRAMGLLTIAPDSVAAFVPSMVIDDDVVSGAVIDEVTLLVTHATTRLMIKQAAA